MHIDSLIQTIPMLNYWGLSKTSYLTYILDDKASPLPLPFYSWMNERKKWNLGRGRGHGLSLWLFGLFFLTTPSNSELSCRHMSEACIHLHSFVFVHLRTERGAEVLLQQMFNYKPQNLRNAHKEKKKKQLPVKARPSFCKVDRLPSENSAGRDALTDFVSRRLQPAQCYWLSRENNPEAEPMC